MKNKLRVLVIDDEVEICTLIKMHLSNYPYYELDCATSVKEAMSKINTMIYDAILCDYYLRPGTASDIIRMVKSIKAYLHIPIIVVSGMPDYAEIDRELEGMGAAYYVPKDKLRSAKDGPDTLDRIIRYSVSRHEQRSLNTKLSNIQDGQMISRLIGLVVILLLLIVMGTMMTIIFSHK